jgi:hypothetical protein
MDGHPRRAARGQRGIALATALIFLSVLTLLGLATLRLSSIELKMAQNDHARVSALEIAQAAIDATIDDPSNTPVSLFGPVSRCFGESGDLSCAGAELILSGALFDEGVYAQALLTEPAEQPVTNLLITSSDKFALATFTLRAKYDRSAEGLGAADIEQGYIELLPREGRIKE